MTIKEYNSIPSEAWKHGCLWVIHKKQHKAYRVIGTDIDHTKRPAAKYVKCRDEDGTRKSFTYQNLRLAGYSDRNPLEQ